MKYTKVCKICGSVYESDARGQRYCSEECCQKAQEINRKLKKQRRSRRSYQHENHVATSLMVSAYGLARKVAEAFHDKVCAECGSIEFLEVHHKDSNPFNNNPDNLEFLCKKCHAQKHAGLPVISMANIINESISTGKSFSEVFNLEYLTANLSKEMEK